jgi:hypothetical protein
MPLLSSKAAYDDQGMWCPNLPGLGRDVQDSIRAGILEAIETVPRNRMLIYGAEIPTPRALPSV